MPACEFLIISGVFVSYLVIVATSTSDNSHSLYCGSIEKLGGEGTRFYIGIRPGYYKYISMPVSVAFSFIKCDILYSYSISSSAMVIERAGLLKIVN
jgi:hypothetical protein